MYKDYFTFVVIRCETKFTNQIKMELKQTEDIYLVDSFFNSYTNKV